MTNTKITSFGSQNLDAIRADINAALLVVAEKYGISSLELKGNMGYTNATFTCQVSARLSSADSPAAAIEIEKHFKMVGFPKDMTGSIIIYNKKKYTITGVNLKKVKYCVEAKDEKGKQVGFAAEFAAGLLGINLFN